MFENKDDYWHRRGRDTVAFRSDAFPDRSRRDQVITCHSVRASGNVLTGERAGGRMLQAGRRREGHPRISKNSRQHSAIEESSSIVTPSYILIHPSIFSSCQSQYLHNVDEYTSCGRAAKSFGDRGKGNGNAKMTWQSGERDSGDGDTCI